MRMSEKFSLKQMFESTESKALAYYGLGDEKELNEEGRLEFVDFIYSGGEPTKDAFLKKVVEAYKSATKRK